MGKGTGGFRVVALVVCLSLVLSGCDTNFVGFVADDQTNKAKLEEARILLDERKDSDARRLLAELQANPGTDSNEVRTLHAAAILGEARQGLWDIVQGVLEVTNLNTFLETVSNTLIPVDATTEEQTQSLNSLLAAIEVLQSAPDPNDPAVLNAACIIGGVALIPVANDAQSSLSRLDTVLQDAVDSIAGGQCNTEDLQTELESVDRAVALFQSVNTLINDCPLIVDTPVQFVNDIISRLVSVADQGCSLADCTTPIPGVSCQDLFPQCILDVIDADGSAVAGDGVFARCELIINCLNPTDCFQLSSF